MEGQPEAIVQQLPQALAPLSELNGGDPRVAAELLKICGLKGKTLEKVVTSIVEATKGLSADDVVVVQGVQRLHDGMTVQPSEGQPAGSDQ